MLVTVMMKKICHSSVGQGYSNTKGPADLWTLNPLAGQTNSNVHDDDDDNDDDDGVDDDDDEDDDACVQCLKSWVLFRYWFG